MNVEKFNAKKQSKISALIQEEYPLISYSAIQKMLRNKDVKINGKRVSVDIVVNKGDEICFYIKGDAFKPVVDIVYQDDNIVVVFKSRGIETVTESGSNLCSMTSESIGCECFAVHRLDRNTQGLVIFAKNKDAKQELDLAFKNRTIEKFYLAEVYGLFNKKKDELVAYLKKDSQKSIVYVSSENKSGYVKIQTNYIVVEEKENSTIVEVELVTGKTHQIRAHMAHIGHFVVGDEKYGDLKINKNFKRKYQSLCAYRIVFHFETGVLKYLNNFEIVLPTAKIDFCQNL